MERIDRLVFAHRRLLTAVCAGLAVLFALNARAPGSDTRPAVVAGDDLAAGSVLTGDQVRVVDLPASAVPEGAAASVEEVVGRSLAGPVRDGEVMTDRRVVDARDLSGFDVEDPALATVRVSDPAALRALRVGDQVDVIAVDPQGEEAPTTVAEGVTVAALPDAQDAEDARDAVGLVAPSETAAALAAAGLSGGLTLVAR
ncbi:MAG: SAF domain-containing protein [Aeromicrobium sp.]|uniref:SAF domain-containing protein n=1 Tax=Aeromicrobium sp. TaxID=1871063 RepID=UPI0039E2BBD4